MLDVSLRELTKSFSGVRAVDHVSVDFHAGEIHAILGENGAGKSTLMHLLSGLYRPDAGEVRLNGIQASFASPRDARAAGIAMVHQHFMLIPTLTIAENILLTLPGTSRDILHREENVGRVMELAEHFGITIQDPEALVATLSVGAQQRVEILKALASNAQVLIFDEPTAVLVPSEVENLFRTLRRLQCAGHLVLIITHKIPEVLAISDRLSILRRGKVVATRETRSCTAAELADLMVGEPLTQLSPHAETAAASGTRDTEEFLALDNVSLSCGQQGMALRGISLTVRTGTIVGIAGVDGNGQTELAELLIGLHVPTQGAIKLYGQEIRSSTPATLRSVGVALIPQDRQREGLALSLTIEENLLLNAHLLATRTPGTLLRPSALRRFAEEQIAHFAIQTSSPQQPVSALSGGNQQRVVIARELSQNPRGIVAVNPTRGLDVGATCYVHQILRERRDHGAAIILISTDLDEIMALSDSISVLYQGNLLGPVSPTTGREQVGRMMTGAWVPS